MIETEVRMETSGVSKTASAMKTNQPIRVHDVANAPSRQTITRPSDNPRRMAITAGMAAMARYKTTRVVTLHPGPPRRLAIRQQEQQVLIQAHPFPLGVARQVGM